MIDSKKVAYLYKTAKVFKKEISSEIKVRKKLKYVCLEYLDRDHDSDIASTLNSFNHYDKDTPILELIKEQNLDTQYHDTMEEIITFVNDLKNKGVKENEKQNYFSDNDYDKYKTDSIDYVKEAIVELTGINISILGIPDEETFKEYFEAKIH